jgi:hypothetical protein
MVSSHFRIAARTSSVLAPDPVLETMLMAAEAKPELADTKCHELKYDQDTFSTSY